MNKYISYYFRFNITFRIIMRTLQWASAEHKFRFRVVKCFQKISNFKNKSSIRGQNSIDILWSSGIYKHWINIATGYSLQYSCHCILRFTQNPWKFLLSLNRVNKMRQWQLYYKIDPKSFCYLYRQNCMQLVKSHCGYFVKKSVTLKLSKSWSKFI